MSNKTSDKNVANIEVIKDFILELKEFELNKDTLEVANALEDLLAEREQMLKEKEKYTIHLTDEEYRRAIDIAQKDIAEQKDKRIKKLEEENVKIKAQHIFTKNKATDKEKAELYDTIDKTLDTFLEDEKPMWEQEMAADKMKLEEALNIVDAMYQDRYKIIEENNTVYVDRLKDVKFTNLEFASVILLREVQSLQRKLENYIPKQVIIDKMERHKFAYEELGKILEAKKYESEELKEFDSNLRITEDRIVQVLQELLEGESK